METELKKDNDEYRGCLWNRNAKCKNYIAYAYWSRDDSAYCPCHNCDRYPYRKNENHMGRMESELKKDMENMENVLIRLGDRTDIWQDRIIYVIAKAVFDLLRWAIRKEKQ